MEILNTTVRNLAIILLLASFLEMLLPSRAMLGFVKLVMGLFVISAILNLAGTLLYLPLETGVPAWKEMGSSGNRALPVLASGSDGTQIGKNAVQEQFKQILQNQVRSLALSVPGVKNAQVSIELKESSGLAVQPQINRVRVEIEMDALGDEGVKSIQIGEKAANGLEISQRGLEVRSKIAAWMQLQEEKITIKEIH